MANTYSRIYIHLIFAVEHRENFLLKKWRPEIFKYITGIIKSKNQKLIAINGVEDHIHILVGITPNMKLSDLVRDIKNNSSKFINDKKWNQFHFAWQNGYGAFSYSHSQIPSISNYITEQENHHKQKPFLEEYKAFLNKFEIEYSEKYLFRWNNEPK